MTDTTRARRTADVAATVVLAVVSIVVAIALTTGAALWAMGGDRVAGSPAFLVGLLGPILLAVLGIVGGVVALVRRAPAFWWPLGGLVLGVIVWLVAGAAVQALVAG